MCGLRPPLDNPGNLGNMAGAGEVHVGVVVACRRGHGSPSSVRGLGQGPGAGRFPAPEARPPGCAGAPIVLMAVAATMVTALVAGSVVAMVDRLGAAPPPPPAPVVVPTLDSLNAAVARGEEFLDGL